MASWLIVFNDDVLALHRFDKISLAHAQICLVVVCAFNNLAGFHRPGYYGTLLQATAANAILVIKLDAARIPMPLVLCPAGITALCATKADQTVSQKKLTAMIPGNHTCIYFTSFSFFIQQLQIVSVRRQAVLTSALLILSRQALHALHYAKEYTMSSYFLRARCR